MWPDQTGEKRGASPTLLSSGNPFLTKQPSLLLVGPEEEGQETLVLWDITLENHYFWCCLFQDAPKNKILFVSNFSFINQQQGNTPAKLADLLQHVSRVSPGSVLWWKRPSPQPQATEFG